MGGEVTEDYIQQAQPEEIPGEDDDEVTDHDKIITRNGYTLVIHSQHVAESCKEF